MKKERKKERIWIGSIDNDGIDDSKGALPATLQQVEEEEEEEEEVQEEEE